MELFKKPNKQKKTPSIAILYLLALYFVFPEAAFADNTNFIYRVKQGETLGGILDRIGVCPMWGKHGKIHQAISLNPSLINTHGNFVRPNELIALPITELPNHPDYNILPSREVVMINPHPGSKCSTRQESNPVLTMHANKVEELEKIEREISATPESEPVIQSTPDKETDESSALFTLTPSYIYRTISLKNPVTGPSGNSTLNSQLDFSVEGDLYQEWSDSFKSFLGFHLGYVNFEPPASATKTLTQDSKFMSGLTLGGLVHLSDGVTLTPYALYQKELFARAISSTSMTVDSILAPSIGAKVSADLFKYKSFKFGLSGVYEEKLPASADSYNIKLGAQYGGIIYLAQEKKRKTNFQTELGVFERAQDTTISSQDELSAVLSLRLFFGGE